MNNYDEPKYIKSWGYVGYSILWAIPIVGWIIWLVNCFSSNTNKKCYARSYFCKFILCLIVGVVVGVLVFALASLGFINIEELLNSYGIMM